MVVLSIVLGTVLTQPLGGLTFGTPREQARACFLPAITLVLVAAPFLVMGPRGVMVGAAAEPR